MNVGSGAEVMGNIINGYGPLDFRARPTFNISGFLTSVNWRGIWQNVHHLNYQSAHQYRNHGHIGGEKQLKDNKKNWDYLLNLDVDWSGIIVR